MPNSEALQALDTIRLPSIEQAFAKARASLIIQWEAQTDAEQRDELWRMLRVLNNVKALLYSEAAKAQIHEASLSQDGTAS